MKPYYKQNLENDLEQAVVLRALLLMRGGHEYPGKALEIVKVEAKISRLKTELLLL